MMDLQFAVRSLRRNPGFAMLSILTMALGIGANSAMFGVVRTVFLRPLPYPDPQQLVTLWESDAAHGIDARRVTPANFADWRVQTTMFTDLGVLFNWSEQPQHFNVGTAEGYERVEGIYASSGFFRVMGVQPILGRTLAADDDHRRNQRHVVIGYRYWQERYGGDPAVIGKTANIDTFRGGAFEIVGVMPPSFDLPRGAQLWMSLGDCGAGPMVPPDSSNRCCSWYNVFGRLKPGVTIPQAKAEMAAIARRVSARYPAAAPVSYVEIQPLPETLSGNRRFTLFALFAAAGCVLLIGCANVANLLLSRAIGRRREMQTRRALGASGWRIARQLFTESLALSAGGALLGLALAALVQPAVSPLLGEKAALDWTIVIFTAGLTVACSLVCSLAPLAESRNADWSSRGQTGNPFSRRLRSGLVVGEVALAVLLVTAAGLLIRTAAKLEAVDMGFRTDRLLTLTTDLTTGPLRSRGNSAQFLEIVLPRIAALPGVRAAGATTVMPFESGDASQAITRGDRPPKTAADSPHVISIAVTPGYFDAMGMRIKAGRNVSESDVATGRLVALINETAARRYWPGENPIGKSLAIGSLERFGSFRQVKPGEVEWREIVGVVSDVRSAGQSAPVEAEVYHCYRQFPIYGPSLVVRTEGDPTLLAAAIRREIQSVNTGALVTRIRTMDQVAAEAVAAPRMRAVVASIFSLVAVALGMLGVYGVMSHTVAQRAQEIGIRMVLGARPSQVSGMVVGRAIRLTAVGLALGFLASMAAARWISSLLFGVQPADPVTLVATCVLLGIAAVAASYLPARRASRVDPATALRAD
jgi:putative ABC transport system permease protein